MRKRGPVLLGAVVVLLLVAVAARGRSAIVPAPDRGSGADSGASSLSAMSAPASSRPAEPFVPPGTGLFTVLLVALGVFVVIAVVALFVRLSRRGAHAVRHPGMRHTDGRLAAVEVATLGGGADAALAELRTPDVAPADAVQRAWMRLEEAAEQAGTARRPAETATEFTVGLLRAHQVPAEPVAVLRGLYQRARFADPVAVTGADVAAAIAAAERILRELNRQERS